VDIAEQTAQAAKDEDVKSTFQYHNAKCLTEASLADEPCSNQTLPLELTPNKHFWNLPVNTATSAVHVPTNVFDRCKYFDFTNVLCCLAVIR